MNNIIKYNNQQLDAPTPFLEIKNDNLYLNTPWGVEEQIYLKGQLTGNFQDLQTSQKKLIDIFSKNFKKLEVLEKNLTSNLYEVVYEKSGVQVLGISFEEANYSKILDYNINLKISNPKHNILSPKDDFDFQLGKDNSVNLTHSVSAAGVTSGPNNSSSFQQAIDHVKSLTGLKNLPTYKNVNFNLISLKESINRLQSTYSIEETYLGDNSIYAISGGLNRYSIDISSGIKELGLKISLQGQMSVGKNEDFNTIKNSFNPAQIISGGYTGYFNPIPISYNFQENKNEKTFSYSFEFDNINLPNPYIKYSVSEQYDNIYKIMNKGISAEIFARGHQLQRLNTGEALLSLIDLQSLAGASFKKISSEKVINKDKNSFIVSANFTNKVIPGGYLEGKYSVSQDISVPIMKPNLGLGGYVLQDFETKTFNKTTVQGDFKGTPGTKPGVFISDENTIRNTESYDPETKNFNYTVEYYGGAITGLRFSL